MSNDYQEEMDYEEDAELRETSSNPPVQGDDDEDDDDDDEEEEEQEEDEGGEDEDEEEGDLDSRPPTNDGSGMEEDESVMERDERTEQTDLNDEDEDDESTVKSELADDEVSTASKSKASSASAMTPQPKKRAPAKVSSSVRKGRTPSVAGLTIPFRTVKKAMKLDADIPIVQNEAAIMTTIAVESFLKSLAKKSFRNAKNRGRNTIRYEDVAEARTQNSALAFLEPLLP